MKLSLTPGVEVVGASVLSAFRASRTTANTATKRTLENIVNFEEMSFALLRALFYTEQFV